MENHDKFIGKMLDNRYEILEKIGTGGMAVVYKARCHRLNRLVAVKILKEELAEDEEFRRRFRTESQAVAMMSHPNIVNVYDVSRTNGVEYIVMELIDGITLKQYINRKGLLTWKEALHFSTQIVKALSHAHSRGIVHRDIKPHNIMILKDGSVKVADFGIAQLTSAQNTLTQEALGSVHYISPEQAKGATVDARSDLYSTGVVMYEMLTSRLPFVGDSAVAVAIQHISAIPLMPREINPDIPVGLEEITMHAMESNLERRYASADEMLADLEEFRKNPAIRFGYTPMSAVASDEKKVNAPVPAAKRDPTLPIKTPAQKSQEMSGEEFRKNRRKSGRTGLMVGIIIVLLFAVVLFVFMWRYFLKDLLEVNPEMVTVPQFVGEKLSNVKDNDEYSQYNFTIEYGYEEGRREGEIIGQSPAVGRQQTLTEKGIDVTLKVCSGEAEKHYMPNLSGKDYREAENELERIEVNLNVKSEGVYTEDTEENKVISQIPAAEAEIKDGDTVYLTYSLGKEVVMTTVPGVVGDGMSTAITRIQDRHLQYKITYIDSDKPVDQVLFQSYEAGSEVEENTVILLQVSNGNLIATPTPQDSEEPTAENTGN